MNVLKKKQLVSIWASSPTMIGCIWALGYWRCCPHSGRDFQPQFADPLISGNSLTDMIRNVLNFLPSIPLCSWVDNQNSPLLPRVPLFAWPSSCEIWKLISGKIMIYVMYFLFLGSINPEVHVRWYLTTDILSVHVHIRGVCWCICMPIWKTEVNPNCYSSGTNSLKLTKQVRPTD